MRDAQDERCCRGSQNKSESMAIIAAILKREWNTGCPTNLTTRWRLHWQCGVEGNSEEICEAGKWGRAYNSGDISHFGKIAQVVRNASPNPPLLRIHILLGGSPPLSSPGGGSNHFNPNLALPPSSSLYTREYRDIPRCAANLEHDACCNAETDKACLGDSKPKFDTTMLVQFYQGLAPGVVNRT